MAAATATKTAPEVQGEVERSFVVLSSAVNVRRDKKQNGQVLRLRRGQIVPESVFEYSDLNKLLALRAVAVNDGEPKKATTARIATAAAARAEQDEARVPSDDFAALDVTADGPSEKDEAPGIEHIEAEDEFEVRK